MGGGCSASIPADPGKWEIQEDMSSRLWNMVGVTTEPAANLLTEKDARGWAKVLVTSGVETQVTITNAQALATLKVCKWSRSPSLQGSQFSFNVGTSISVTAVAGASAATAGCSEPVPMQPGSRIQVTEAVPAGEKVTDVRVGGSASLTGWKNPVAKVTVGTGVNIVTFENEPLSPPQLGYVELCKDAGDPYVSGDYTFTLTDRMGASSSVDVLVGQCSGPIQVPAGNLTIDEAPTPNVKVTGVMSIPASTLGLVNLANGTATVVVPVTADPTGEVQVHFTNSALTGTLKICKQLTASSAMLSGSTFTFDLDSANGSSTASVIASTNVNGACKLVPGVLPVGSTVTVTERGTPWVGSGGGRPGDGETQTQTIVAGTNTVTFTNQAYGQLEICKNMQAGDEAFNETNFKFTVSGVPGTTQVAAGHCSMPLVVPAGTVTVTESPLTGFLFVSSTGTGPLGQDRATSGTGANGGNPITVKVPWFADPDDGGETQVTVVNRVLRAHVKICKYLDPGSTAALSAKTFTFSITVNGAFVQNVSLSPPFPVCTGLLLDVPIVNAATGAPATIKVKEVVPAGAGYAPSSMSVDNYVGTPSIQLGSSYISFSPGVGTDVVSVTNKVA